jgi:hypothetical protein
MYSIGQVLFAIIAKKNQVYPMQVVEVITKKTLKGEEVKYALRAGSDPNSVVMLDQVEGEVFESAERVRQVLVQRATNQINKMVEVASAKSVEWYSQTGSHQHEDLSDDIEKVGSLDQPPLEDNQMTVTLPDGTIAKIRMPAVA